MPKFHPKKFHFGVKEQVQAKLCLRRSLARDQENSPSAALLPKVICYINVDLKDQGKIHPIESYYETINVA